MNMLERIKKKKLAGFKEFVESLEQSPREKKAQILMTGLLEDPLFMSWVMKNTRSFDDFMKLPSEDIELIINSQDQMMIQFAKCFDVNTQNLMDTIRGVIPRMTSNFENERAYVQALSAQEKNAARSLMVRTTRKLMTEERVTGFHWQLPPMDLFYPKAWPDGITTIRYESHYVAAEGEMFKGKKTASWLHYYENGEKLAQGNYFDGLKIGKWSFYYPSGKPKSQGSFRMDIKVGLWTEWDAEGRETLIEYKDGVKAA